MKEYGVGAQILKALGIRKMRLLCSGVMPDLSALSGFGLEIAETITLEA